MGSLPRSRREARHTLDSCTPRVRNADPRRRALRWSWSAALHITGISAVVAIAVYRELSRTPEK